MNIIKPNKVEKGATIGFLSVCGPVYEQERLQNAKKYFENLGYKVVISDTSYSQQDFLCADDNTRIKALEEFFTNPEIDAILCTRGGYGALRLLDKINYEIIKSNPKYFGGFSDVTALLTAITKHAQLETYHSPMPYPDFGNEEISELTEKSFLASLEQKFQPIKLNGKTLINGEAEGILWGGNLATLASMVGFDFIPNQDFIFFLEDVNEPAYKLDRYLTQLSFCPNFKKHLQAIIIGELTGLDEEKFADNLFTHFGETLAVPVISGLKVGHVKNKYTLPIGAPCKLSTDRQCIEFFEKE